MLEAIRYARESGLPFFGICLGMQTAIIEFARSVIGLADSHSSEFAPECDNAVISLMEDQQHVTDMGGTMRLGAYPCRLGVGTQAAAIYGAPQVSERHRHRYEVNNKYRDQFIEHGLNLSGAFGVLANVVWTDRGPCAVEGFEATRLRMTATGGRVTVYGVDKFPRLLDYLVPTGVRIADADRVRLGAHLAPGTTEIGRASCRERVYSSV